MTKQTLEACPGCGRSPADAQARVSACDATANAVPGRCAWRARRMGPAAVSAPSPGEPAFVPGFVLPPEVGGGDVDLGPAPAAATSDPLSQAQQQLADEKAARLLLRDRLRQTEALAAESNALRSKMSEELDRVNGEVDRLRVATQGAAEPFLAASAPVAPPPPVTAESPRRRYEFLGLGLALGLLVGVVAFWWQDPGLGPQFGMPGPAARTTTAAVAPAASGVAVVPSSALASSGAAPPSPGALAAASSAQGTPVAQASASAAPAASGVDLPAALPPTAAGASSSSAVDASRPDMAARVQAALAGEGVTAPVSVDAGQGKVSISDPEADNATRDRTDTVIRAVFAGASLPPPQIEHRWVSPQRPARVADAASSAAPPAAMAAGRTSGAKAASPARRPPLVLVPTKATAGEMRPIVPSGRLTEACKASVANVPVLRRTWEMSACMKGKCCTAANRQTEECQAFDRAYPLNCPIG